MKTALDLHIENLLAEYRIIVNEVNCASVPHAPRKKTHTSADAKGSLLCKIKEAKENCENEEDFTDINSRVDVDCFVNRERFFERMTKDQKDAGECLIFSITVSIMNNY